MIWRPAESGKRIQYTVPAFANKSGRNSNCIAYYVEEKRLAFTTDCKVMMSNFRVISNYNVELCKCESGTTNPSGRRNFMFMVAGRGIY